MTTISWYKDKKKINEYYKEEKICTLCDKTLKRSTINKHKKM